jgi:DNA-binding NarL/FixJ family response regulator
VTWRVVLADDHPLVRAGLAMLVNDIEGFSVAAEAGDGVAALARVRELQPDLLLLDIHMPRLSGLDCLAQLAGTGSATRVLMLSMHTDAVHVGRALELGASGYLLKGAKAAELELAMKTVCGGGVWLSSGLSPRLLGRGAAVADAAEAALTPRQLTILKRLAEGAAAKEIAFELGLSVKTVETHRAQIMARLDLHDIPALVRYAIRRGLVAL